MYHWSEKPAKNENKTFLLQPRVTSRSFQRPRPLCPSREPVQCRPAKRREFTKRYDEYWSPSDRTDHDIAAVSGKSYILLSFYSSVFYVIDLFCWHHNNMPGTVARSDARPPGMRPVAGSILTSGKTFFHWDLVMKTFLRPFSFKKGSCQLLAKEWALSTGKLPRRLA